MSSKSTSRSLGYIFLTVIACAFLAWIFGAGVFVYNAYAYYTTRDTSHGLIALLSGVWTFATAAHFSNRYIHEKRENATIELRRAASTEEYLRKWRLQQLQQLAIAAKTAAEKRAMRG